MKTKNIKYLIVAVCAFFSTAAMAQGTRISGTVSDLEGPIMMCNVVEIDANNRIVSNAQTDINGNFSMEIVNTKNKLQVSYVGYKKKTLPIGDKTTFHGSRHQGQTEVSPRRSGYSRKRSVVGQADLQHE